MAYLWGKLCLYVGAFNGLIVTFNPHPFAEGSTKQSHEGIYGDEAPTQKYGQTAVVKKLKNGSHDKSPLTIKTQFDNDILTHKLASKYASIWNQTNENKKINMQIPYMAQINKSSETSLASLFGLLFNKHKHSDGEYILVEDYLPGKFEKFNSNTGWVKNNTLSLNAFSHWSYHHSNGEYLICDLQGVSEENKYELTDPVIMSTEKDKIFGNTDLGI
eukprot:UN08070